ncbi:hypothetical protein [Cellulophaga omnivescoria]|uniref:hypothetical protein n=1 Tax=Cellulophaga omnivescoria TaxID=1888890 RepID=UPI0009877568|nr:hypothetical protein [Cellulophaga omnivescoria]WBU90106.1 hypothetical protein PBN93_03610 [Cellulophaga omnivescoria]WKB82230.1 hypothetical protein QYR09_04155 [Cellulophaga lytica]
MKKAYKVFLVLSLLLLIPFLISFFPSSPTASTYTHRDPSGFGSGYESAIIDFIKDVVRVVFGLFATITVMLKLALSPDK